jgi:SAM-dependent methyltransferase
MYCPCCETESEAFLPFGVRARPQARCPRCGALERHRLLWLFLRADGHLLRPGIRLLHVAPEPVLGRLLRTTPHIRYIAADLAPSAGVRLDLTALPIASGALDAVVCNHVLEHVPDDRRAMQEIRRALRPGGWAILQAPLDPHRATTFEDPAVTEPADRERLFGQHDHVRMYGRDYVDRLEAAGFAVDVERFAYRLTDDQVRRCGLRLEAIHLCRAA